MLTGVVQETLNSMSWYSFIYLTKLCPIDQGWHHNWEGACCKIACPKNNIQNTPLKGSQNSFFWGVICLIEPVFFADCYCTFILQQALLYLSTMPRFAHTLSFWRLYHVQIREILLTLNLPNGTCRYLFEKTGFVAHGNKRYAAQPHFYGKRLRSSPYASLQTMISKGTISHCNMRNRIWMSKWSWHTPWMNSVDSWLNKCFPRSRLTCFPWVYGLRRVLPCHLYRPASRCNGGFPMNNQRKELDLHHKSKPELL